MSHHFSVNFLCRSINFATYQRGIQKFSKPSEPDLIPSQGGLVAETTGSLQNALQRRQKVGSDCLLSLLWVPGFDSFKFWSLTDSIAIYWACWIFNWYWLYVLWGNTKYVFRLGRLNQVIYFGGSKQRIFGNMGLYFLNAGLLFRLWLYK